MEHISSTQYQELIKGNTKKRNKFGAVKEWLHGLCFDSRKESNYYAELQIRHRANEIAGFLYHGKFVLVEGTDKSNRAMTYEPDFLVLYPNGKYEIVDTKGFETQVFKNKMKIMREKYPEIEVKLE